MNHLEAISTLRLIMDEFDPGRLRPGKRYSYDELAEIWGCSKNSIYSISNDLLPRIRTAGGVRLLGIDILRYEQRMPPLDHEINIAKWRPAERPTNIRPMQSGKQRLM